MRPVIAETGYEFVKDRAFNALNIYIDARPTSCLAWESLETEIETALKLGAKLVFEIDLGFSEDRVHLRDPASFFSRGIGISQFEERVYKRYKEEISAIILYRGKGLFQLDEALRVDFLEWAKDLFGVEEPTQQMLRLFSMELFMQYLHRVSASLIDDVPLVALFDFADCLRPSYQAELLSQSFFPYILPGVKNALLSFKGFGWEGFGNLGYIGHKAILPVEKEAPTLGIVMPEMGAMPYDLFDEIIACLHEKNISYCIFPESLITDNWHGLDHILVFSESVTSEGRRMLQGFNAAAGQVITVGDSLGLLEEIDSQEFIRSRGI